MGEFAGIVDVRRGGEGDFRLRIVNFSSEKGGKGEKSEKGKGWWGEVRKRSEDRYSPVGAAFQPRFCDLNDLNDFDGLNDLPLTIYDLTI